MPETHSRELLEALLAHSTDLVTVLDGDARITCQSPSIERLLGYDPDEVVGTDVFEYVHPEERARAREAFATVASGDREESDPVELRLRRADGSWTWVEAVSRTADVAGTDGYVVNARDISERKDAERERNEIFGRMADAFFALDDDWRFTYLNARAEELLERSAEELLGKDVWAEFPDAVDTVIYDRYHEAMETQEPVSFETHYDPLDTTLEVRAYPSESGLSVYFRNVTEARRTKRELERNVETLRRLYGVVSDPDRSLAEKRTEVLELGRTHLDLPYGFTTLIDGETQLVTDAVGTHELLQPGESCPLESSYCRKTIETTGALAIHDAVEAGWKDDPAYETFELGSYIGGRVEVDGELRGTLCFAAPEPRGRSFTDSEQTFVELASRWLSYEHEEAAYQRQLERRNERLDEFASVVSHDLRNPLTVVKGRLELARERYGEDDDLAAADAALDRAFTIIEDVLAFARAGDRTLESAPQYVAEVAERAWEIAGRERATLDADRDGEPVVADQARLQQLFENLFRNALEHAGSEVTVRVGRLADREGFYVADDGPGVPADEREQVFEFGHSGADGSGIGLAIVRDIAQAHGWSVRVTEAEAGGARFEFLTDDGAGGVEAVHGDR